MIEINGIAYPMWSRFVEGKDKWIGGTVEDLDPHRFNDLPRQQAITNITLTPNGDHAFFAVHGEHYVCGFSTEVGRLITDNEGGWTTFQGYDGHRWRIRGPR